jgi:hypothetical protein
VAGNTFPDVLTLQDMSQAADDVVQDTDGNGAVAVTVAPPRTAVHDNLSEARTLAAKRRRIVIRHTTGDRIVALLEIVSPGNKDSRDAVDQFVEKAAAALYRGFHLLVVDLFPPGPFDPQGMRGKLWANLGGQYLAPPGKPLTLAAYASGGEGPVECYVEPTAIGLPLLEMPIFLTPERYVNVPLEQTYQASYVGVPNRWKRVIEAKG